MRITHLGAVAAIVAATVIGSAAAQPASPAPQPATPPSSAAAPAQQQTWLVTDKDVAFTPAPIAFPLKAGALSATNHKEASHEGENLDNMIEYYSPDRAVFGTVYIYFPGLSHAGLAAIAEDWAIRKNWPAVTGGDMKVTAAGDAGLVAIRTSYARYRRDLASTAAYIKAGRWLVTVRISGPETRRPEIEAAMDALLQGITFGHRASARPAAMLAVRDCNQPSGDKAARSLPDPPGVSIAAQGVLGTFDGAGIEGTDDESGEATVLPTRVPPELCRAALKTKMGPVTLLRAADGEPISIDGRSVRIALLTDSGRILEVDHAPKLGGYVLFYHDLGETDVLGTYDAIPSDKQLANIIDGVDQEGGRIRVPVRFHADRGPDISLPSAAPATPH